MVDKTDKDRFLEMLSRANNKTTITIEKVEKATRKGVYISVRTGLSSTNWFVGNNERDNLIVENVG